MTTKHKRKVPHLHIGVDVPTLDKAAKYVMAVLATSAADAVKLQAIELLERVLRVENITVSNCTIGDIVK